jgi:hypothetical protein
LIHDDIHEGARNLLLIFGIYLVICTVECKATSLPEFEIWKQMLLYVGESAKSTARRLRSTCRCIRNHPVTFGLQHDVDYWR